MKSRKKVEFNGSNETKLAGLLEFPSSMPLAFVLFAHCFTCGKDIAAASRISRAMVSRGFAVLRFDFTGLGGSDGDFSNTNFSSNVDDLVSAADFLRQSFKAPTVLIGHSLGGTAVLMAASKIPESLGVVTIGSPADAEHVVKQFCSNLDEIVEQGQAEVNLAGRQFTIKKQFVDDAKSHSAENITSLRKALLIFHSPVDSVVSIKEAEKIYTRAKHPKSFISLDSADHLLTKSSDAQYVADSISIWATRFIPDVQIENSPNNDLSTGVDRGKLLVEERNHEFTQNVISDQHFWMADEPLEVGGANLGPDPYEHLLAALGSCTTMTLRMYANRKQWPVDDIKVELSHSRKHGDDCKQCDEEVSQIEVIDRVVTIKGQLSQAQLDRLLEIADRCPVHRTLHSELLVETRLST